MRITSVFRDYGGRTAKRIVMKLEGKVALVTGSSQGIGQAIAIRLASEGADILIDSRSHLEGAEVAGEVLTMKQLLTAYEEATGKKLQEKRLNSVEDLRAWIEQKKPLANSPVEYIPQQYEYAMVFGKGKLDNIQNSRYPDIKPLTVRQYLEQTDL
jgi:NAD(P)-dependent dehydrogenase (short-subunit alcohol dehydrogenase family)